MNAWLPMLAAWLMDFALIATVLLLAAGAMRLVLRDPGSRVLLMWGTWLAVAAGAGLTALPWWPRYQITDLLAATNVSPPVAVTSNDTPTLEPLIVIEPVSIVTLSDSNALPSRIQIPTIPWSVITGGGWLAALTIACGWIVAGFWQARRLLDASQAAPSWIVEQFQEIASPLKPAAELRTSLRLSSAVAIGAAHPTIILPQESDLKAVRAALAHEWAHIRNGDLWLLALERLLLPLLALHPLFWWLRRSTRLDQELLADAAAAGDKPVEYAEALVALAKAAPPAPLGLAALAMNERPSNLSRRIQMILHRKYRGPSRVARCCAGVAVVMMLCLVSGLSLVTLHAVGAQEPAREPAAAPQSEAPLPPLPPAAEPPSAPSLPAPASTIPPSTTVPSTAPAATQAPVTYLREQTVIELAVNLLARDYDRVKVSQLKTLVELERIDYQDPGNTERHGLKGELDEAKAQDVKDKLQALEGVTRLCNAKIIALSGQQARLEVIEPGPTVTIVESEGSDGKSGKPVWLDQTKRHVITITPRTTADANRVELTVYGGRLKTSVTVGKTLLLISGTENEIMFVTPTIQRQVVPVTEYTRPGANPAIAVRTATAAVPGAAAHPAPGLHWAQTVPAPAVASAPPAAPVPLPGRTPIPATAATPSPESPAGTGQRLAMLGIEPEAAAPSPASPAGTRVPLPPTRFPTTAAPSGVSRAAAASANRQRKLLELDLAEAKLGVEVAMVELSQAEEIRKKNPSAVSEQELRKLQLQVDRAKIQVKRIEVQLEEPGKAAEPPAPRGT